MASLGPRGELSIATTDTTHVPVIDDILVTPSSDGEEVGTEHLLQISYPPPSSVLPWLAAGPGHLPLPGEGGGLPPGPGAAAAALLQPGYTGTGGTQGVQGVQGYTGVLHRWRGGGTRRRTTPARRSPAPPTPGGPSPRSSVSCQEYNSDIIISTSTICSSPGEHLLPQDPGGDQLGGGAAAVLGLGRGPRLPTHLQHVHTQELATGDV